MTQQLDLTLRAWTAFQKQGSCDEATLAPPILRSWRRSAAAGVDPYSTASPPPPSELLLDTRQETLVALAQPYMEDLYQFVEGSGFAVLLLDASLTLIEVIGDKPILDLLHALGLDRGSCWREDRVGTLALNLALHEALPFQTISAEHFRVIYHPFASSAAPLFDVDGQAMGVLGVLGQHEAAHAHTLGMVIAAAQAIHAQIRNNLLLAEANEHMAELNAAIEAMSEGLIFLDVRGRLSRINSRASQMLGLSLRSVAGTPLEDLLELPTLLRQAIERRRDLSDQEFVLNGRKGPVAALCSVRPVTDRGRRYLGALITLRTPETIHRLVQRVVGAQAQFTFADIVGESPTMQAAVRQARIAANSQEPILLEGEPGVGKRLLAHAIHNGGRRSDGPFVVLDCAAAPRALIMSELLGYEGDQRSERGTERRPGKLELAQGGTLMLASVNALPVEAQTTLLRAIETQHLIRIGGRRVVTLDTRIVASAEVDMQREVNEGRFRAELHHRLSALHIRVPALRERGDDVLLLINDFLAANARRLGKQTLLAPDALAALLGYPWPGNVRELDATLERLLHSTEKSVLTLSDLPLMIARSAPAALNAPVTPTPIRLHDRHAATEREAILRAGREAAGHLGRVAERLGISRATLWRKMKQYGIEREHFWTNGVEH